MDKADEVSNQEQQTIFPSGNETYEISLLNLVTKDKKKEKKRKN
jgi:hypothetical protein